MKLVMMWREVSLVTALDKHLVDSLDKHLVGSLDLV